MTVRRWQVDTAASHIVALVFKDGLAARLSHDHVILAHRFRAKLEHDPQQPESGTLEIVVEAASLEPDPPGLRARFGLGADLSASDRRDTQKNMLGRGQLDVGRHPHITLRGHRLNAVDKTRYRLQAKLCLCGVTRPLALHLDIVEIETSGGVRVGGSQRIRQTDFGIKPYKGLLGAMKVKDEVELRWELLLRAL